MHLHIQYDKGKVLQALRYHFISRQEIKILLIVVNVFAILSAGLFAFNVVRAFPFLISSLLWFSLMLTFWFWLPRMVYRRSATFKEDILMRLGDHEMTLETEKGYMHWAYQKFAYFIESPFFYHLYINDKSFFLIPKDACTSGEDLQALRQLLEAKIGRR